MTDGEIAKIVESIFDMRPYFIEQRLKLRNPIYSETAAYGHMGRKPEMVEKTFTSPDGKTVRKKVNCLPGRNWIMFQSEKSFWIEIISI